MIPILLHIYGSFCIQSYGFFIVVGILLFIFFVKNDEYFKLLKANIHLFRLLYCAIFAALIGGRMLSGCTDTAFSSWYDVFSPVYPGFSILGSVLGVLCAVPLFLKFLNLPILPCMDVIATHAPLVQACGRIGCFFAGCCYGIPGNYFWCVIYSHPLSLAPCGISYHPTQLYSALLLFLIFLLLKKSSYKNYKIVGKQTMSYLILVSVERFLIDFWRQERFASILHNSCFFISDNQIIAGILIIINILAYAVQNNYAVFSRKLTNI